MPDLIQLLRIWQKEEQFFAGKFENSLTLTTQDHRKLIIGFLRDYSRNFTVTLLYRGTRDGWNAVTNIHPKVDNKGPTISIIKTTKNKIFGGFTTVSWDQSGTYKADPHAFIFSVDLAGKYPVDQGTNSGNAVYSHQTYLPNFGNHSIHVSNNANAAPTSYVNWTAVYPTALKHPNGRSLFNDGEYNF
jgi:hypothetical protein